VSLLLNNNMQQPSPFKKMYLFLVVKINFRIKLKINLPFPFIWRWKVQNYFCKNSFAFTFKHNLILLLTQHSTVHFLYIFPHPVYSPDPMNSQHLLFANLNSFSPLVTLFCFPPPLLTLHRCFPNFRIFNDFLGSSFIV
jgi:hypothetical protein